MKATTFFVYASFMVISALGSPSLAAERLPSDEEVNGIFKLCALGRIQRLEGDVRGKIELWKRGVQATGKASLEDLGALLDTIRPDPSSIELYKLYTACIKDNISQYLASKSSMLDPDTVLSIVDVQKYRDYLEEKLGKPAYIERGYRGQIIEAGYRWKKLDLQIFYLNDMSVQYTVTVTDRFFKPKIAVARFRVDSVVDCLGCAVISSYGGTPYQSNMSSKFFTYVEEVEAGSTSSGFRQVLIGYTTYGAEYASTGRYDLFSMELGDAVQRQKDRTASRSDLRAINQIRSNIIPNSYTVRYSLIQPAELLGELPPVLEWGSAISMPQR